MGLSRMGFAPRKKKKHGTLPVYLNVYDLTPINGYAYWLGLGVYHSGVQVHGVEYAFGAHHRDKSGIFEVEPRKCPGFVFRKSLLIGKTDMGPREVRELMEKLAEDYSGNTYHLILKNCNHFCDDVCVKLTNKPIPRWVNRLARIGLLCNCVLPTGLNEMKVQPLQPQDRGNNGQKKKLRCQSNNRTLAAPDAPLSSSPSCPVHKQNTQKPCIPPSSSAIQVCSNSAPVQRRKNG